MFEYNDLLSKAQLGEILAGSGSDVMLLVEFTEKSNFAGLTFDGGLRKYLTKFMLPGEAQKIDRIMEVFASKYHRDNPGIFPDADAAFVLAFALIMLNTDRHNPSIAEKDKMTKQQFIRNVSGTWQGKDPPEPMLEKLYNDIVGDEILMKTKGDPDKKGWMKSIKTAGGVYEKGRTWFCLIGNELLWYKKPTLGKGEVKVMGKIKLEYVSIREQEDRFSITSTLPKYIEFTIYEKQKPVVISSFDLCITCETVQQVEHWANAVRMNVTFDNVPNFDFSKTIKTKNLTKFSKKTIGNKKKF
uniref:SEC7 domain-containing protein n=1 Tax=Arcella intermedia TaxID=1963864 RepID=A0A6B2L8S8_9EUKA